MIITVGARDGGTTQERPRSCHAVIVSDALQQYAHHMLLESVVQNVPMSVNEKQQYLEMINPDGRR